jgi:hypothetical protein
MAHAAFESGGHTPSSISAAKRPTALIQEVCPAAASYGFGVARLATTLLTITTLSGWRSSGVVIAKFSAQVVAFRSSPTVLAETPVDRSALTRIRSGKPPRARWSPATFFGLYRMMTSSIPSFATGTAKLHTCSGPHATALGCGGSAAGHGGREGGGLFGG